MRALLESLAMIGRYATGWRVLATGKEVDSHTAFEAARAAAIGAVLDGWRHTRVDVVNDAWVVEVRRRRLP